MERGPSLSDLLDTCHQRFCELLRELCEVSGLTQGKMARMAEAESSDLKARGMIGQDVIIALQQPVISTILSGKQQPTYCQLYVIFRVLDSWYQRDEIRLQAEKRGVWFDGYIERSMWHLAGYVTPEELQNALVHTPIVPSKLAILLNERKEKRLKKDV